MVAALQRRCCVSRWTRSTATYGRSRYDSLTRRLCCRYWHNFPPACSIPLLFLLSHS